MKCKHFYHDGAAASKMGWTLILIHVFGTNEQLEINKMQISPLLD